jgi:hypothetical protein
VGKIALLILMSLGLISLACVNGRSHQARIELTPDHLTAMMLTRDDIGPDYADFGPDARSGPRTSEQLVEESNNPDDEALDVAKFAILLGQEDTYVSARTLNERTGVIYLTNGVVLYADAKGAAADLADMLGDQKTGLSGTTKFGTLQSFKTFKPKVGQSAHGQVIRLVSPGSNFGISEPVNVTITAIEFQRDRIVGSVVLMRFDPKDVKAEATDLARKLDRRIQVVLRGELPPGGETTQVQ